MNNHLIPHVTPTMARSQIDQFCATINKVVDAVNELEKKVAK